MGYKTYKDQIMEATAHKVEVNRPRGRGPFTSISWAQYSLLTDSELTKVEVTQPLSGKLLVIGYR